VSPLGLILIVILIVVLLGGVGPVFYQGAPWQPGYGLGNRGIGLLGAILIIILILWVMGYIR
jgi:hypothetical protein